MKSPVETQSESQMKSPPVKMGDVPISISTFDVFPFNVIRNKLNDYIVLSKMFYALAYSCKYRTLRHTNLSVITMSSI